MGLWQRLFGDRTGTAVAPLYAAIVAKAREPHWYEAGAVPDTLDGRFDMVAAVLSLVLIRLEDDPAGAAPAAHLAERFVADMDGQLREIGIGDIVVGKHVGRMMGMLGGRLGAYREALAAGDLAAPIERNVYRGDPPGDAAVAHVRDALAALHGALAAAPIDRLVEGDLP
ncbi:MAG: ubiquinol-cytochrome C chaperone family protein [Sphingomonas sp.]